MDSSDSIPQEADVVGEVRGRLIIWIRGSARGVARVIYDAEEPRQRLIDDLAKELQADGIPLREVDLSLAPWEEFPGRLIAALEQQPSGVVSVSGFRDGRVHDAEGFQRAIGVLNLRRETLAGFPLHQIWWMPEAVADAFRAAAPDLHSWFLPRLRLTPWLPLPAFQAFLGQLAADTTAPGGVSWPGVWKAIGEAENVNPIAALDLGFFQALHQGLNQTKPERLAALAKELRAAKFEEVLIVIHGQGVRQGDQLKTLARIFAGLAEYSELDKGLAPTWPDLLKTVSRMDTLPDPVLAVVRGELGALMGKAAAIGWKLDGLGRAVELQEATIGAVPAQVVEAERREMERQRGAGLQAFEREYLKAIKQEYGYMQILGIPSYSQWHPIDAGFISLSLASGSAQAVAAESALREHPRLVIVGEAGAGKTTLMQWEAVRCCEGAEKGAAKPGGALGQGAHPEEDGPWSGTIPFFIRLRRLVRKTGDYRAFPSPDEWVKLSAQWLVAPAPPGWLHAVLREGRALLILDGLDELPPERRLEFWRDLEGCLRQYELLRFRVTSRPFPRENEKADQWRLPLDRKTRQTPPEVRILELAPDRVDRLIDQWHLAAVEAEATEELRERTRRELAGYAETLKDRLRAPEYAKLLDLAKTPFFAAAICLINRHRRQLLPEERHELYRMLVDALLGLRDRERGIISTTPFDNLKNDTWVRLHARLALDMMTSGMRPGEGEEEEENYLIEVNRRDALTWIGDYIQTLPVLRGGAAEAGALLDYMMTRCGLLREPAKGRLDFRHRALQEYLAGTAAMLLGKSRELAALAHDDRWRETIVLAAGGYGVGDQEAIRLIRTLIERGERENRKICFAIAVACLETAGAKVDASTEDLALGKLGRLVPPRDSQDAKALAAAGERAAALLAYPGRKEKEEVVAACAETLRRIGSEEARTQLRKGYIGDGRAAVAIQIFQCPGISPLEVPAVIGGAGETKAFKVPEIASPYLQDLAPLAEMAFLRSLDLTDCGEVADLSPLEPLRELRWLSLEGCGRVSDLSPLEGLSDLESLNLGDCSKIADLGPLAGLKKLQSLCLRNGQGVADLGPLGGLASLRSLSLRCCGGIADLGPLAKLDQLEELDLAYCDRVMDLSPLRELAKLRTLDTRGCPNAGGRPARPTPPAPGPGLSYIETVNGLDLKMVWIEGGEFRMGSPDNEEGRSGNEGPVHPVELDGFWMGATQVTNAQYQAFLSDSGYKAGADADSDYLKHFRGSDMPAEGDCPVVWVSWNNAQAFCQWLSVKTGLAYALPTEAQWEYACRAGSATRFCFGDMDSRLGAYGWYDGNSGGKTNPVGRKRPNAWGLYDVHGNVWEWCLDWYGPYGTSSEKNAKGPRKGDARVLRGGSWNYNPGYCRAANRYGGGPACTIYYGGFRVSRYSSGG